MQFHDFVFGHIEVEAQGRVFDLHNFYRANSISYDIMGRMCVVGFNQSTETWVPAEEARKIRISFHEVDYFCASGRHDNPIHGDDEVLHSIGVVEPDAKTEDSYLTDSIRPDHHLVICFESGLTLRVQASEARCEVIF